MRLWSSVLLRRLELVSVCPLLTTTSGNQPCPHWQPARVRPGLLSRLRPTLGRQSLAPIAEAPSHPPRLSRGDCRGRSILLTTDRTDQATEG